MKITEELLKAKGWEVSHYDLPVKLDIFNYATKMFGKDRVYYNEKRQLTIFRDYKDGDDTYADVLIDNVDTVEKLMKALTLCGVGNFKEYEWLYETWLDKACDWLKEHTHIGSPEKTGNIYATTFLSVTPDFIGEFRKALAKNDK